MRIRIAEDAVEILSTCHVPGCERRVTGALPMEAFEDAGEGASGLEGKLFGVMMKGLRSMVGREVHVAEVVELPPVPCEYHAAALAVLGRERVSLEDGDDGETPTFYFDDAVPGPEDSEEGDDGE